MRKRSELIFSFLLVPVDVAALLGAFVAAYLIRVRWQHTPVAHLIGGFAFLRLAIIVMPVWILIFALTGLYGQSNLRGRLQELGKIFVGVSGGVMFMILLDFASKQPIFPSRSVPIYAYGLGLVFVTLARIIVRGVQRWLFRYGVGVHHVLLAGSGKIAQRIRADLDNPRSGYLIVGVVDNAEGAAERMSGLPTYRQFDKALAKLPENYLDGIIQADSALDQEEVMELVTYASNHQLTYQFVPNQFGLYATNSSFSTLAGVPMMEIRLTPLEGWGRIAKRGLDLVAVIFGIIILSPIFLIVALLVWATDGRPIIYRHTRLSRSGRKLFVYKFRTMRRKYGKVDAITAFEQMGRPDLVEEFKEHQKVNNDPRATRLGAFLRRTSLDELPQLFNVLWGDMSLVGPRPILEEELARYGEGGPTFLSLKPGITGMWQISGRSDISYDERVKLDIYYVEHWSLWLDIKVLAGTVVSVLRGKGAV